MHIQTYARDRAAIIGLLEISEYLTISTSTDPGPEYDFPTKDSKKKEFENTSRMFQLGSDGLCKLSTDYCCKTRVELVPDVRKIDQFIYETQRITENLKVKGQSGISMLPEHYSGPLTFKKGTLCAIADTFLISETIFCLKYSCGLK